MSEPVPLFSSDRERRLWAWTLAVVVAIYSTLGLAGTLAGAVSQELLAAGVLLCMLLVFSGALTGGRTRSYAFRYESSVQRVAPRKM